MPSCMISTPDRLHNGKMMEDRVERRSLPNIPGRLDSDNPPAWCRLWSVYKGVL